MTRRTKIETSGPDADADAKRKTRTNARAGDDLATRRTKTTDRADACATTRMRTKTNGRAEDDLATKTRRDGSGKKGGDERQRSGACRPSC